MVRKNGFSRPFNPYQVVTWVLTAMNFLEISVFLCLLSEKWWMLTLFIIYALSLAIVLVVCILAMRCDPEANSLELSRQAKMQGDELDLQLYPCSCTICHASITDSTRHCSRCDKCIEHLDHHCILINNCIGSKNYKIFIVLLCATITNYICFILIHIKLLEQSMTSKEFTDVIEADLSISRPWLFVFITVFSIEGVLITCTLLSLLLFHLYLYCSKMTTCDFITKRRTRFVSVEN